MDAAERRNDGDGLSSAMPVWTESISAVNQDSVLRHSEIPVNMQMTMFDSSASRLVMDHLQSDASVEISLRESRTSSSVNIVVPTGVVYGSMLETTANTQTVKTKSNDFSVSLKSEKFTAALPRRNDSKLNSKRPSEVFETHISEDANNTLLLHNASTAARDAGNVSTAYKSTTYPFSGASRLLVSALFQKSSAVATAVQTSQEAAHSGQFLSSTSHSTAVQETTSQLSETPSTKFEASYTNEFTSAVYHSSFHVNDTRSVMKSAVSSSNSAALTTAISIGVVLGIFTTFVITVSLVAILRRRRKTDNVETVQREKLSMCQSKMCSVGSDYTEVKRPLSQHGSVHKADEMFLLPHEQVIHNRSSLVGDDVKCGEEDGVFDELNPLIHIDTDMSSILQVIDSQLLQHSYKSNELDDMSRVDTDGDSAAESENQLYHLDSQCHVDDDAILQSFHEYDPVYVPRNDAAAMFRRVDDETSYVRTLQPPRNFSPYEEVCYGVRPLLLSSRTPAHVNLPTVPPRTSSVTDSHLQNSVGSGVVADDTDKGGETD